MLQVLAGRLDLLFAGMEGKVWSKFLFQKSIRTDDPSAIDKRLDPASCLFIFLMHIHYVSTLSIPNPSSYFPLLPSPAVIEFEQTVATAVQPVLDLVENIIVIKASTGACIS